MKKIGLFTTVILGLCLMLAVLWVLGGQNPPAAAAPLTPNSGAEWDGLFAGVPMVISSTGKYQMWYLGRGLSFHNQYGLGYAESPDGLAWNKHPGNPVLEPGDPGEWDDFYRGQIGLIEDGGIYKMWYSGAASTGSWQTGYATSTNGLDWDIYPGNPVLVTGGPGSWDETESDGPTVIKDGATYKMWYHGCNFDCTIFGIGYATSSDGTHWSKYAGNPVLEPTTGEWDESGIAWPRVIKTGPASYHLWYHSDGKLGYATSTDGIQWVKSASNPVLSDGWGGGGVGVSSILLEGGTYKMWLTSGIYAAGTRGIGYAESPDGINWTQPVSNPLLVRGEPGVIIDADYEYNRIRLLTLANTAITITVSDAGGAKATINGMTDSGGWYQTWEHNEDWTPDNPDILPGDTVNAETPEYTTSVDPVGEIEAWAHNDTDLVEGSIHAPAFGTDPLTVLCELYTDPSQWAIDHDVPANGGSFECDFSGSGDIVGGLGGSVSYLEPDGDMVSVNFIGPYMEVFYGRRDGVGGIYPIGHTFWITVTNSLGDIKATAVATSTFDGGWWGHGFMPTWAGGDCCNWSPTEPDIQPGDWVYYDSDDGYENQVRAGTIYGIVDVEDDSVTGPIYAPWLDETLVVWCHPQTLWPYIYRESSAEPDGSVPYFCEWQTPVPELDPWDIQPDDDVMVDYTEPDGDKVYRMMIASEGAPPPKIYLPVMTR